MNHMTGRIGLRLLIPLFALPLAFAITDRPGRNLETALDTGALKLIGIKGIVAVHDNRILLVPPHHDPFLLIITSACSSLAPVLALISLALTLPSSEGIVRRIGSTMLVVIAVVLGNLLRLDACMIVGLHTGIAVEILFHNVVGAIFSFVYILGGYLLMVYFMIPKSQVPRSGGGHAISMTPDSAQPSLVQVR